MNKDQRADFDSLLPAVPFTRRDFVATVLASGFALAVRPVMAQTAISTNTQGLVAGEIKVKVADGEMVAYRAQQAQGKDFSVVLVVSEIFGVHECCRAGRAACASSLRLWLCGSEPTGKPTGTGRWLWRRAHKRCSTMPVPSPRWHKAPGLANHTTLRSIN